MNYREKLLTLARIWSEATGLSEARAATLAQNQGAFFVHLKAGRGCTMDTYEKVLRWFSENWPEDIPWPDGIEQPTHTQNSTDTQGTDKSTSPNGAQGETDPELTIPPAIEVAE